MRNKQFLELQLLMYSLNVDFEQITKKNEVRNAPQIKTQISKSIEALSKVKNAILVFASEEIKRTIPVDHESSKLITRLNNKLNKVGIFCELETDVFCEEKKELIRLAKEQNFTFLFENMPNISNFEAINIYKNTLKFF